MKPLKKGKVRTDLTENLMDLTSGDCSISQAAAVLGGAIDEALKDLNVIAERNDFWHLATDNCWRMTRALRASGQLDKIK